MRAVANLKPREGYTIYLAGRSGTLKVNASSHALIGEVYCFSNQPQEELDRCLLAGKSCHFVFEIDKARVKYLERGNVLAKPTRA